MKVRQSVSVTSELGDPNNLASFNGELREQTHFLFLHCDIKVDAPECLNLMFSPSHPCIFMIKNAH